VYRNLCRLTLKFIQSETHIYRCTEVYMVITFLQDEPEVYAPDPEVNNGLYRSLYKVIICMVLNIIHDTEIYTG